MSHHFLLPEGLKNASCERGNQLTEVPLRFVPSEEKSPEGNLVKIKITEELTEQVPKFEGGSPEGYVALMDTFESICRKQGLRHHWKLAKDSQDLLVLDLEVHKGEQPTPEEGEEPAEPAETAPSLVTSGSGVSTPGKRKKQGGGQQQKPATKKQQWDVKLATITSKIQKDQNLLVKYVKKAFLLFERLLGEDAREHWTSITFRICDCDSWADDRGVEHTEKRGQTWLTLALCQREFMRRVFKENAAEEEQDYLLHRVTKAQGLNIRPFVQRLRELNRAIKFLPGLSTEGASDSSALMLSDAQLCGIIKRSVPRKWIDLYMVNHKTIPTDVDQFLEKLEKFENLDRNRLAGRIPRKDENANNGGGGGRKGKRSGGGGDGGGGGKKQKTEWSEKYCQRCKKNGGPYKSHNTKDCLRYDEKGQRKPKPNGGGGGGGGVNGASGKNSWKKEKMAFMTSMKRLEKKFDKVNKKKGKASRKRKRFVLADSSDESSSDSE